MRSLLLFAIVTVSIDFVSASAYSDEPLAEYTAPWGRLRQIDDQDPIGFVGQVDSKPADGRLALPDGFPPIVACTTYDKAAKADVYVSLDYDTTSGAATVVLPDSSATPGELIEAVAAERVTQNVQGTIVFPANGAVVVGKTAPSAAGGATARLESNGTHHRIGFWTDPADYVAWDYDPTRWGRYRVLLTYSTASSDGGVATIEMGDARTDVSLPSTGSWYRYRTIEAGNLYLATDEKQKLIVRAKKLSGPALMNLKAVFLIPTFESDERAVQAEDGTVTLHARDAMARGTKLRYEPKPEKNTLGFWTEKRDYASWGFDLREGGEYDVEVWLGCGPGQGGSEMVLIAGDDQEVPSFEVEETGHFQNFVPRIVGRVQFAEAGRHHLSIVPAKIAKAAACDIRQIRLIPAK